MRKHPVLGRIAGYAFAIVFILAGWQFTAMAVHNPVLPGPFDAFPMVAQYYDELWPAFLVSLYRVVVAMLIGTVLAIPLGLACGRSPRADAVFAPILYFLYPLPKVVLLPVLIVLLGLADAPKIVLIAITVFFQVLVTVRDASKSVPEQSILSMRSLGASRLDIYRHAIVPATLPELFTALRISSGTAVAILEDRRYMVVGSFRRGHCGLNGAGLFHRECLGAACLPEDVCGHYRYGAARCDSV